MAQEMIDTLIANKWTVKLPPERARWDGWGGWELARFDSMGARLRRGDILFDVGAEQGDQSAAYAQMVGPENMVLFEPCPAAWPNIRVTWEGNGYQAPRGACAALVGAAPSAPPHPDFDPNARSGAWPACSVGEPIDFRSYRYIHEHRVNTAVVTLDDWADENRVLPSAITVDVEGAELEVMRGACRILGIAGEHLLVWISVHPDLMERDYGATPEMLHAYMADHGLRRQVHLATDHEQHWLYER